MQANIEILLTVGKALSALMLLVVLVAIVSVWRRRSFPSVGYGGVSLSYRRLRWLWVGILLGSTGLGIAEDPIASLTHTQEDPEVLEAASSLRNTGMTLPLPFYRYERERTYGDGELASEEILEGFLIPWPLLSGLIAYLLLVLRWNPENRWALRILRGRRWRDSAAAAGAGDTGITRRS
jgi:hypothetical protein